METTIKCTVCEKDYTYEYRGGKKRKVCENPGCFKEYHRRYNVSKYHTVYKFGKTITGRKNVKGGARRGRNQQKLGKPERAGMRHLEDMQLRPLHVNYLLPPIVRL